MTCIVGMVENGKVVMGADSLGASGWDALHRKDPKVFRNGQYLIGFTSSYRMGQILMVASLPKFEPGQYDEYQFMLRRFVPGIREALSAGGYIKKKDEREEGGTFLVGFNGRLFNIADDFQVAESSEDYDACGCGRPYALATMRTLKISGRGSFIFTATGKIRWALMVAAHYSNGVGEPFTILAEE